MQRIISLQKLAHETADLVGAWRARYLHDTAASWVNALHGASTEYISLSQVLFFFIKYNTTHYAYMYVLYSNLILSGKNYGNN